MSKAFKILSIDGGGIKGLYGATLLSCFEEKFDCHIADHFDMIYYVPSFWIQGSYKMSTMIRTKDDTCDCDEGVYFNRRPGVTGTTLQKWVKEAVEGVSGTPPEHREKCIRVVYKSDYHIDLPVYYQIDNQHPNLAVKNKDFEKSDSQEFVEWFRRRKDTGGQLLRIIRYLKAWCDHKRNSMPSGLVMTVLAQKNIHYSSSDDQCLLATLRNIQRDLQRNWQCKMPTTPQDDLLADYDDNRKKIFFNNIASFISDAETALSYNTNDYNASLYWKKHLGQWFPIAPRPTNSFHNHYWF